MSLMLPVDAILALLIPLLAPLAWWLGARLPTRRADPKRIDR